MGGRHDLSTYGGAARLDRPGGYALRVTAPSAARGASRLDLVHLAWLPFPQRELRRLPPLPVRRLFASYGRGRREPVATGTNQEQAPGGYPGPAVQDLVGGPVFISLTEEQEAEMRRLVAEANKRSADNAQARGGR